MSQLTKKEAAAIANLTHYSDFAEFQAHLGAAPGKTKRNKFAGNAEYVPISYIEAELDSIFGAACWQVENFHLLPLGSSTQKEGQVYVAATLDLKVLHPITMQWITRAGTASGYVSHNVITTFAPKLKAEAIKNAAKSIGDVFGRNLNREEVDSLLYEETAQEHSIVDQIANASTMGELKALQAELSSQEKRNPALRKLLNERAKELS